MSANGTGGVPHSASTPSTSSSSSMSVSKQVVGSSSPFCGLGEDCQGSNNTLIGEDATTMQADFTFTQGYLGGTSPGSPCRKRERCTKIKVKVDLKSIVEHLLEMQNKRPGSQMSSLIITEEILTGLAKLAKDKFISQPMLVDLDAPVKVCGDVHGQYFDLLRILKLGGFPPASGYLFLGDYVDRGQQSLECLALLFAFKLQYPELIFLLRGNHESENINRLYGFFDECKRRHSVKLYKSFNDTFNAMPVSGRIADRVLCMHGGLSPDLSDIEQILRIDRPNAIPERGLLCDLLWSDPSQLPGWNLNERGVSYSFGADIVEEFCEKHSIDLICRAHQVVEDGYDFFAGRRLVTIFGAPNYCGEFDNSAALLCIDKHLMCSFQIVQPIETYVPQHDETRGMNAKGMTIARTQSEEGSSEEAQGQTPEPGQLQPAVAPMVIVEVCHPMEGEIELESEDPPLKENSELEASPVEMELDLDDPSDIPRRKLRKTSTGTNEYVAAPELERELPDTPRRKLRETATTKSEGASPKRRPKSAAKTLPSPKKRG